MLRCAFEAVIPECHIGLTPCLSTSFPYRWDLPDPPFSGVSHQNPPGFGGSIR